MIEPLYSLHQKRQRELHRRQQRIDFALRQETQSTTTASDSITFQNGHHTSMVDALKEVRKNKSTIPDGMYLRPENNR